MVGWSSCTGRFVVEKNNLRVTSPESIRGIYECALGNFGVPQYGGSMSGAVIYPKANQKACKNFNDFDISFRSRIAGLPTFVLVDRGGHFLFLFDFFCYNGRQNLWHKQSISGDLSDKKPHMLNCLCCYTRLLLHFKGVERTTSWCSNHFGGGQQA